MAKQEAAVKYPIAWYAHYNTAYDKALSIVSKEGMVDDLRMMVKIRQFELRGKAAYLEGKIGGFYHSYAGEEACAVAAVRVFGKDHPYTTTYRCHGLALALGMSPYEGMAELFGKKSGVVGGRGGSMHFHFRKGKSILTGGFGIVGGHLALAAGTSFARVYKDEKEPLSICFLGDGAVVQGVFHETLNLCSLWNLPSIYIIENNTYGMGTHVDRALSFKPIAKIGELYGALWKVVDGHHYFDLLAAFDEAKKWALKEKKPVVLEVVMDRYEGHSMSDSMPYRTREDSEMLRQRDPITCLASSLVSEKEFTAIQEEARVLVLKAVEMADQDPMPDPSTLGEGVLA